MEIKIEVDDVTGFLCVQNHIGTAKYGKKDINIGSQIPDGSIIIKVGDKTYKLDMAKVVGSIAELDEKTSS